eukprot:TRINITY_DN65832_c0_g1_i6.p1 TRINITY_DN65832_c0_g1~~TRINITY_DN65832_c0_g1_i6.p1  ORF type:complete len:475 (+),score=149.23 TRINITY_DN65832_c0_g1_i6:52-1425(+)
MIHWPSVAVGLVIFFASVMSLRLLQSPAMLGSQTSHPDVVRLQRKDFVAKYCPQPSPPQLPAVAAPRPILAGSGSNSVCLPPRWRPGDPNHNVYDPAMGYNAVARRLYKNHPVFAHPRILASLPKKRPLFEEEWVYTPLGVYLPYNQECPTEHYRQGGVCHAHEQQLASKPNIGKDVYGWPWYGARLYMNVQYLWKIGFAEAALGAKDHWVGVEIGARTGVKVMTAAVLAKNVNPGIKITAIAVEPHVYEMHQAFAKNGLRLGKEFIRHFRSFNPDPNVPEPGPEVDPATMPKGIGKAPHISFKTLLKDVDHVDMMLFDSHSYQHKVVDDQFLDVLDAKVCRFGSDMYHAGGPEVYKALAKRGWTCRLFQGQIGRGNVYQYVNLKKTVYGPLYFHYDHMLYFVRDSTKLPDDHPCKHRVLPDELKETEYGACPDPDENVPPEYPPHILGDDEPEVWT